MPQVQNPVGKKDIKVTDNWDISISQNNGKNDIDIAGQRNQLETLEQVIRLALKTKKNTYLTDTTFGASPKGRRTYMTPSSINDLVSYVKENLLNSGVNPNNYPMDVKALPIGNDSIALHVALFLVTNQKTPVLTINVIYNESTQDVQTIKAFGR